jgi:hypothetical protein
MGRMIVPMFSIRMSLMGVLMPCLCFVGMGMLVFMMVRVNVIMLMGMDMLLVSMLVGMLMLVVVRMFVIVGMRMFSFHDGLLFIIYRFNQTHDSSITPLRFPVNTVPQMNFIGSTIALIFQ